MKSTALLGLAALLALGSAGCNTNRIASHSPGYRAVPRIPTYALAVTVRGGLQPTPSQWAAIQAKVAEALSLRGAVLVTNIDLADRIIRVDFQPSDYDPENAGHISILGVRTNPYRGLARSSNPGGSYFPAFSFASAFPYSSWWGASNFYSGYYYNYMGPWENGYTYTTIVSTLPKPSVTRPPHRPPSGETDVCPPDTLHPRRGGRDFAASASDLPRSLSSGSTHVPAYTSPEPSASRSRWSGERSAWRSEALAANQPRLSMLPDNARSARTERSSEGSSRSSRSSWADRSDRSYSRSESSSRSDWSRPSYTSPSYDSSHSSSSSSSYMSASSSHLSPSYTSPSPSSDSSSSSSSSGSMSFSSSSSSSSESSNTQPH